MKARVVRRWTLVICAVGVAAGVMATSGWGQRQQAIQNNGETAAPSRYVLSAGGQELATFSELRGLSTEVQVSEYMSSTDKGTAFRRVAGNQQPKLALKRAHTRSGVLWEWHEAVVRGDVAGGQRDVTLAMLDTQGKTVVSYYLENAFPSKIEVGVQKAGTSETLTETVTVVGQHIQRLSR